MNLRVAILFLFIFEVYYCKLIRLSCSQIRAFVDGHNSRRLELARGDISGQPPASDMKYMIWDKELAAKAAKWASKHVFQHNPDTKIGSGRFETGENLYWYGTTNLDQKLNPDRALKSWFDEYKQFTYQALQSSDFNRKDQIGHYTQMAWSNSVYVGCAISNKVEDNWNKFIVVCNYGPAGNYIGQKPYQTDGDTRDQLQCSIDDCTRPYGDRC